MVLVLRRSLFAGHSSAMLMKPSVFSLDQYDNTTPIMYVTYRFYSSS